jgi:hypothetical protein
MVFCTFKNEDAFSQEQIKIHPHWAIHRNLRQIWEPAAEQTSL